MLQDFSWAECQYNICSLKTAKHICRKYFHRVSNCNYFLELGPINTFHTFPSNLNLEAKSKKQKLYCIHPAFVECTVPCHIYLAYFFKSRNLTNILQVTILDSGVQNRLKRMNLIRGAHGALYRKCHTLSWPGFWLYFCQKLITSFSWTIPFNEEN